MKTPAFIKQLQTRRSIALRKLRIRTLASRKTSPRAATSRVSSRSHAHRKLARVFSVCLAAIIILSSTIGTVFALDEATLERYGLNGVYWYDATGGDDCLPITNGGNVTIIGDSITEGALQDLKELLPQAEIYAKYSKTFGSMDDPAEGPSEGKNPSGVSILKWLLNDNKLQNTVVYALGTNNNPLRQSQMDAVLDLIGPNRTVFFLTNYNFKDPSAYDTNNNIFRSAAELANVQLIDWQAEASKDTSKYMNMSDSLSVHLSSEGDKLWAELISKAVGGSGSLTAGGNGNYTNYAGDKVLSDKQIELLEANIPFYEKAIAETGAAEYGITWQILAAFHYLENGLRRNSSSEYGIYQIVWKVDHHDLPPFPVTGSTPVSDEEFLRQTKVAIDAELKEKVDSGIDLSTADGIKRLFFVYNGAADRYKQKALALGFTEEQANNGEGSIYVMNGYDAPRDPFHIETMNPVWRGKFIDNKGTYDPTALHYAYGAYVVYESLGGASACGTSSIGSGGLTLEQAKKLIDDYVKNVSCGDYGGIGCVSSTHNMNVRSCRTLPSPTKNNCVTFVKYFLQRFGDLPARSLGNGNQVVSTLTKTYASDGFEYNDSAPRPFAIFSTNRNADPEWGHTGVVLGVDEANNKILIGQMGCSLFSFDVPFIRTIEYDLSTYSSGAYWYAYTDGIIDASKISEALK